MRIYLIGFMGSGKTHIGKKLSERFEMPFVDLDEYIETREHLSIAELFELSGEEEYRNLEKLSLRELEDDELIIACGGGTPCFNDNMSWINEDGVSIYLEMTAEHLYKRLKPVKSQRPLLKDIPDEKLLDFIYELLSVRKNYYVLANFKVDVSVDDEETVLQKIDDYLTQVD